MIVGYARTSTADQLAGFEAQIRDLKAHGCEKVFSEQVSSVAARAQLDLALDFVREGDVFVVTKLDRLARSIDNLRDIARALKAKGVALRILDLGIDTNTPTGELMLNLLGAVAQFERSIMLERQREGINKARAARKYEGRASTTRPHLDRIRELAAQDRGASYIARELGISRAAVYRVLEAQ
jgi:DNA invertase Pin-like site-specific DNA recombinase